MAKVLLVSILNQNLKRLKNHLENGINITELFGSGPLPMGVLSIESFVNKSCAGASVRIVSQNMQLFGALHKNGLECGLNNVVADFESFLMDELRNEITEFKPDIIGFSVLFDLSLSVLKLTARETKKLAPDAILIAGGHPIHNLHKQVLQENDLSLDAVCMGEGEIPFAELVNANDRRQYLKDSPYFITMENTEKPWQTAVVQDLDDIPMYNYDGFIERYGDSVFRSHSNVLDFSHAFNKQAEIMTSRGCPYNCVFCSSNVVHGKKMRAHSLERVFMEIDYWVDRRGMESIGITDDHFLYDVDRAIKICDYAGKKKVDMRFLSGLAIEHVNQDFVDCCVRNNVKEVNLALESGSEYVLRSIIRKPLTLSKATAVFSMFNKTDVFTRVYLVIGFPDEKLEHIEEGLKFLRTAEFNWASISAPVPISGSRLYNKLKDEMKDYNFEDASYFARVLEDESLAGTMNGNIKYAVNLDINFINNPYMRMGKYAAAAERFSSIIKNYPDHAFAYYFLAQCQKHLGQSDQEATMKYTEIFESDPVWRSWREYFKESFK